MKHGRGMRLATREAITGIVFVSFTTALVAMFALYPIFLSLRLSLASWLSDFAGILKDPLFWFSVKNTLYWTLMTIPLVVLYPLGVAVVLHRARKVRGLLSAVYYLPSVVGASIWFIIWMWIYNPSGGLLNAVIQIFAGPGVSQKWITSPRMSLPALAFMGVIVPGLTVLLFMSGLDQIPSELYEAANLDGARRLRSFFSITLPLLKPTLAVVVIPAVAGCLQVFGPMMIMLDGGPGRSTFTYVLYAFYRWDNSTSSLLWIVTVVVGALSILQLRLLRAEKL